MAEINGTNGNDNLVGTEDADTMNPLLGLDTVDGRGGSDTLVVDYSTAAIDPYAGASIPSEHVMTVSSSGGSFAGTISAIGTHRTVFSNIEHLQAKLDSFHDRLVIDGSALALGATLDLDGAAGTDTLEADLSALGALDLQVGPGVVTTASFGTISGFENFRLKLGSGADTVTAGAGHDILAGGGGGDTLDGGGGNDLLYSAARSPSWQNPFFGNNPGFTPPVLDVGSEADTLRGGSGYDRIFAGFGDTLDGGGDGADLLISLQGASSGVTADFRALANGGSLTIGGGPISSVIGVLWIEGSEYDDTLTGSDTYGFQNSGYAPIFGRGGNDHLTAGAASGNIYGGDGNDVISSAYNTGHYHGDGGDDIITASGVQTHSFGGEGNDTLNVAGGANGGAGNDVINMSDSFPYLAVGYGDGGDDQLNGSAAASTLAGGAGADILSGNDGNDTLYSAGPSSGLGTSPILFGEVPGEADSGTERDQLSGGADNDRLSVGYGDDADGGSGTNILALSLRGAGSGVTLHTADIVSGAAFTLGGGTIRNFQSIAVLSGSSFGDTLTFAHQSTGIIVYGEGGDDTINAPGTGDTIRGGAGADIINAGGGDDTIHYDAADDAAPGEQVNGGSGVDTIRTAFHAEVDLSGATLTGIERIITGAGAIVSTTTLSGVGSLSGNFRFANGGIVSIASGQAIGSLFFSLSAAGNQIDLSNIQPNGFFQVYGKEGEDVITASATGGGNYYGGGGNDVVTGGSGTDFLYGNEGNDRLEGRGGGDWMTGGAGDDLYFVDTSGDRVLENGAEGTDEVRTGLSVYQLPANVENLRATTGIAHDFRGNSLGNVIVGDSGSDFFRLQDGGNDSAYGGDFDDVFYFGAAFNAADLVDGGFGVDTLALQGNYAVAFGTGGVSNLISIEAISLLSGSNTRFGGPGTNRYDYNLATIDSNVAPGIQLRVNGANLLAGEDFTFNGAAEQDGRFVLYGGLGRDLLTGGAQSDIFFFGFGNTYAPGDVANGGGGYDGLFFRGDYVIDFTQPGYENGLVSIENVTLSSASDLRHERGGDGEFDYDIRFSDAIVGDGVTMTVNGGLLTAGETMNFDASLESSAHFRIFAGASGDSIHAGGGSDMIYSGLGSDALTGGAGADTFRYDDWLEATAASPDWIKDFVSGSDLIDLSRADADIDAAGNQAFAFIGEAAFSGVSGELRVASAGQPGLWRIEADVNGNGFADLVVLVTSPQAPVLADFVL